MSEEYGDRYFEAHCNRWAIGHCFSHRRERNKEGPCHACALGEIAAKALELVLTDSISERDLFERELRGRLARFRVKYVEPHIGVVAVFKRPE